MGFDRELPRFEDARRIVCSFNVTPPKKNYDCWRAEDSMSSRQEPLYLNSVSGPNFLS
jgi:hypothetical protein